jgi:DNA-binding response OmpR family regulator
MGKRILVVDDEPQVVKLLAIRLKAWGYDVDTAQDGVEALEALGRGGVDGMTLGIFMPRINGLEVLFQLRKTDQTMPVVVISAGYSYLNENNRDFLKTNAQELLVKPFAADLFKQVVERWFGPAESGTGNPG